MSSNNNNNNNTDTNDNSDSITTQLSIITTPTSSSSTSTSPLSITTILFKQIINNQYLLKLIGSQIHKIHIEVSRKRIFKYHDLNARWLINRKCYATFDNKLRHDPHFYLSRDEMILFMADNTSLDRFLKVFHRDPRAIYSNDVLMDRAASAGSLEIVQYIHNHILQSEDYRKWLKKLQRYVSTLKDEYHILNINNLCINVTTNAIVSAANAGHFTIVKYLAENRTEGCNASAYYMAAKNCHLEILDYLLNRYKPTFSSDDNTTTPTPINNQATTVNVNILFENASQSGKIKALEYVFNTITNKPSNLWRIVASSISRGRIQCIQYLIDKAVQSNAPIEKHMDYSIVSAVRTSSIEVVRLVYETIHKVVGSQFTIPHSASTVAASKGYLEILQYLVDHGCQLNDNAINLAAGHGHLEVVQYLNQHIQPLTTTMAVDGAAAHGSLPVVKYLTENGYAASSMAMNTSAMHGNLHVVQYLHENRTEGATHEGMYKLQFIGSFCYFDSNIYPDIAIDSASANGHLEVVQFLLTKRTEGCSNDAMDWAASNGFQNIIEYLHENGKGCSANAMDFACSHAHFKTITFLHEKRSEGCTTQAMNFASSRGHVRVLEFLDQNRTEGSTEQAFNWASSNNRLAVLQFLHQRHLRLSQKDPTLTNESLMSEDALLSAVRSGCKHTALYILEHFRKECNVNIDECKLTAIKNGNFHILDLMDTNNPLLIFTNQNQKDKQQQQQIATQHQLDNKTYQHQNDSNINNNNNKKKNGGVFSKIKSILK